MSIADEIRALSKIAMREAADTSDEWASKACGEIAEKLDVLADRVDALVTFNEIATNALKVLSDFPCISELLGEDSEYDDPCGCARCFARATICALNTAQGKNDGH